MNNLDSMSSLKRLVGYGLLQARLHVGMSQEKLADELGCHASQVSRWERGHFAPTLDHLGKISVITGVSLDWLILGVGKMLRQDGEK